jgi:son of sevenless-like protein
MMDILSGLNSNPIHRLAKTWELVDSDYRGHFKRLTDLVNPKKSYAALRSTTKDGGVPCMPYIGMHLTDVLFIEDGNKDKTKDGLINFTKRRLLGGVIRDIQVYQQMPYDLQEQPMLRTRLQTLKFRDLDYLLDVSQTLEPPVTKKKKKKVEESA